jgi:hypothetical protein
MEQDAPEEQGLLAQIRSTWEFASLMQYIAIFGQVMKIDEEFEIEVWPPVPVPNHMGSIKSIVALSRSTFSDTPRSVAMTLTPCPFLVSRIWKLNA